MFGLRYASLLAVLAIALACATSNPAQQTATDAAPAADAGDTLSPDERSGFDGNTPSVNAYIALVSITDRMVKFDPTIDTTKRSAGQNALAIDAQTEHDAASYARRSRSAIRNGVAPSRERDDSHTQERQTAWRRRL